MNSIRIISSIGSLVLASILVGQVIDYRIDIRNLGAILLLAWVLYPIVKVRVRETARNILSIMKGNEENGGNNSN